MANPYYTYSGAFIPGSLAKAEAETTEFTAVQTGFALLAIQGSDTGVANAYVVATKGGQNGVYADGMIVEFKATHASTAACTIAVDSGAVVGLTQPNGGSLVSGAILANVWYRAVYNSTYSAFTVAAPTPATTITSNTISGSPPTNLVGLTGAGGVSTAAAPIDATYAINQSIVPTWTGAHVFSAGVTFNGSVTFATGITLTGAADAYALTANGSSTTGHSYGLKIAGGTNTSDISFLVNSQAGTTRFKIDGAGSVTVGAPTGAGQGAGTINATGLYINGVAVSSGGGGPTSANPSATIGLSAVNGNAATFMTSDSAPPLGQGITPTWTGAHTFTPSSAVTAATINAAINTTGFSIVGGTNTVNHFLASIQTGQGSGFSGGLYLSGGTTSGDIALQVQNAAANATFLALNGDGSGTIGATGSVGMQWTAAGVTTVNASSGVPFAVKANGTLIFRAVGITSPTVQGYGPTQAGLVDLTPDYGTYTVTYTGMTGSVTGTAVWARVGPLVTLFLPAATGTSNATTFTATGMPAVIRPARSQTVGISETVIAVGATYPANACDISIATSGVMTFTVATSASGWPASGTKGVSTNFVISYLLI